MRLIHYFRPITVGDTQYRFNHLKPYKVKLEGQGKDGDDLVVRVSFRSHVFSTSCAEIYSDFRDAGGSHRQFCTHRYQWSNNLREHCRNVILQNARSWISTDANSSSNLAVIGAAGNSRHLTNGRHYAIFYKLRPSGHRNIDVEFVVKSAFIKQIYFNNVTDRNGVRQKIKECYYQNKVVP